MHLRIKSRRFGAAIFGLLFLATAGDGISRTKQPSTVGRPWYGPPHTVILKTNLAAEGWVYLNQNAAGGAIQGEVGDAVFDFGGGPTGLLGIYDPSPLDPGFTLGAGITGYSSSGVGVYAEAQGTYPAVLALGSYEAPAFQGTAAVNGLIGISSGQNGVVGESTSPGGNDNFAGVLGQNSGEYGGYGIAGQSVGGDAVYGDATGEGYGGYFATNNGESAAYFVQGSSTSTASIASADGSGGAFFAGSLPPSQSGNNAVEAFNFQRSATTDLYGGFNGTTETFIVQGKTQDNSGEALYGGSDVQVSGDLYVYGRVYTGCSLFPVDSISECSHGPLVQRQATAAGYSVNTYGAQQSQPTLEDTGRAELVNGASYVAIDPAFAVAMAHDADYIVLITPEGDNRGLYVASRSAKGFVVRETQGARDSLSFAYRIVAKPYGDTSTRLAVARQKDERAPQISRNMLLSLRGRRHSQPKVGWLVTHPRDFFAAPSR